MSIVLSRYLINILINQPKHNFKSNTCKIQTKLYCNEKQNRREFIIKKLKNTLKF